MSRGTYTILKRVFLKTKKVEKHQMLERTSSGVAPWTIIRSSSKPNARLNAMKVLLNAVDYADRNPELDFSVDKEVVISGKAELARMDEERDRLGRPRG